MFFLHLACAAGQFDWVNLIDPEPRLLDKPHWATNPDLGKIGLLDYGMEPKEDIETWLREISDAQSGEANHNFIVLNRDEYAKDPQLHLPRLWKYFRETYYS